MISYNPHGNPVWMLPEVYKFLAKEYILDILTKTMGTQRDEKDISVFTTLNLEVSFPLE